MNVTLYVMLNVTQQCRRSPMLIFRAWATCAIEGANDLMVSHCIPGNAETLNRHQLILN